MTDDGLGESSEPFFQVDLFIGIMGRYLHHTFIFRFSPSETATPHSVEDIDITGSVMIHDPCCPIELVGSCRLAASYEHVAH